MHPHAYDTHTHTHTHTDTHTHLTLPPHTHTVGVLVGAAGPVQNQSLHVHHVAGLLGLAVQMAAFVR